MTYLQFGHANPLNNASTEIGMMVEVILEPVNEKWWNDNWKANLCWSGCLPRIGYKDPQMCY